MGFFGKKKSNQVAKERLKLVLIHDRNGTSTDNNFIKSLQRDIMKVLENYIDISDDDVEVRITREQNGLDSDTTKLLVNVPIRNVKCMGKNK